MRTYVMYICIAAFFASLVFSLSAIHLGERDIASYYLRNGARDTGSPNIVNSIVWDFRSYDTLGEETVLFTAALGVFLVAERRSSKKKEGA